MTDQKWPESKEFRTFAAGLADAVQFETSCGVTIRTYDYVLRSRAHSTEKCNCPLGALTGERFPCAVPGLDQGDVEAFVAGFESGRLFARNPYNQLGLAYRERFVK